MNKLRQTKSLGELCDFQRGLTYAKTDEVDASDNIVLRATNIDLDTNLLDFSELKYINDKVVVPISKKVKRGSLIICTASGSKSHLGKVAYIDKDYGYAFGGFMGMITPKNGLVPKYLFYLLTSQAYKDFIDALADGTNINNLKFDDLSKFQVPYPASAEQQRIVGILDNAFDSVATAKANTEKNVQNAHAIFESYLQSVFTRRGAAWKEHPLSDVCDLLNGFAFKSGDAVQRSHTQLVRMGNLYGNNLDLDRSPVFYPDSFAQEYVRYRLNKDDLIMSLTGTTGKKDYGYVVRIPESRYLLLMNQRIAKFVLLSNNLHDKFLYYYLRSKNFLDLLYATANGTRQANLSSVTIKSLPIPLCPMDKQRAIASDLDVVSDETQSLARQYKRKLKALDALKKSFLSHAFTESL